MTTSTLFGDHCFKPRDTVTILCRVCGCEYHEDADTYYRGTSDDTCEDCRFWSRDIDVKREELETAFPERGDEILAMSADDVEAAWAAFNKQEA